MLLQNAEHLIVRSDTRDRRASEQYDVLTFDADNIVTNAVLCALCDRDGRYLLQRILRQ